MVLQYGLIGPAASPALAANGLLADTEQGFEIDGDVASGNAASNPGAIPDAYINNPPMTPGTDWNGVYGSGDDYFFRDAVDAPNNIAGDTTPDTSAYAGGNKEVDTRDWSYYNSSGPNGKTDYRHVMAYTKVAGGNAYAFVGAERVVNNGSMVVDFELNRLKFKTYSDGISKPNRSVGDVLISLEYANGGSNPIVTVYRIASVTDYASGQVVTLDAMSDNDVAGATRSATNWDTLVNAEFADGSTYDVAPFDFAEASVNLSDLNLQLDCLSFQQGSIRSRTGGAPTTSQLKDASDAFPLDLNTCGKLTIEKRDKITNALVPGAQFVIEPDPTVGSSKASLTVTDGGANDPDGKADGKIVFSACEPDTYKVTETAPPPGYFPPADLNQTKTIGVGGSATFTFEDPLAAIRWEKNGPDGTSLLGGATFTITPNPYTGSGSLEVADNGPHDADNTAGEFRVNRVLIGGPYTIAETTPPAGYIGTSATASVTIPSDMAAPYVYTVPAGTFVNTLGSLRWQKEDVNGALLAGATFEVSPDPRDGTGTLTITDNDANDADKTDGKFEVKDARTGEYTVTETAAPSGYIMDSAPAKATVSAETPDPKIADGTFVNHLGQLTWVKHDPDGKLLGGATFHVTGDNGYDATVQDCVATPCTGADQDPTAGQFKLTALKTGTYTIEETKAPSGYVISTEVLQAAITDDLKAPYTVDAGSVTNGLGSLTWVKNGPDGEELLGGATFTITPNPQTGIDSLVVVDNDANDADKTDGQFKVTGVLVDKGSYTIAETAAPAGYVGSDATFDATPTTATPDVTVPAGTWVNTLGSLSWEKRDGHDALLGGATFEVTGPDGFDVTVVDNDANDANKADGQFKLTGLFLGEYTVTETAAPSGYILDGTAQKATLTQGTPDASIASPFVNTLGSLAWTKVDGHDALLGGATFHVTGPFGYDVSVTDNSGLDADPADGKFLLEDLKLGEYTVTETAAPSGYILDSTAQKATVTAGAPDATIANPFVNTLGELLWTKDNGSGTLIGGATFSVTPNPFTGTGSLSVTDNDSNDQDAAAGKFHLVDVRVGSYSIVETAAPEGYVADPTPCQVSVSAANPTGTKVCSFSNTPIPPAIDIVKTAGASTGSQAADGATYQTESFADNVTYKYVVTNTGEVRLTDVWVVDDNGTPANSGDDFLPACSAGEQALSQPFELAAGASVTCYATRSITQDTTNIATASGKSVGEGTGVQATDDAVVEIIGPAITIVKTAGSSMVDQAKDGDTFVTEAGTDNVVYQYVITNTGDTALNTVALVDDKLGSISCGGQTTLAVGTSVTCYATASVMDDTVNVGDVTAKSPAGAPVEATDDASVILRHVSIQKTNDATAPLIEGEDVVYTLTFSVVNGPIPSMTVTDTLPAQVVNPRDFSVAPADVTGQVITWNLANVADGAKITYTATIDAGTPAGSYTNTAEITEGPCTADGCTDDSTVEVIAPDVTIAKNPMPGTVMVGQDVVFEIVAKNAGPGTAKNVVVTDQLPSGLAWEVDNTEACSISEGTLTCNVGDLAEGSTFTVHISAPTSMDNLEACGTPLVVDNTATVTADNETTSTEQLPNSASAEARVLCAAISLVKTAGDAPDGTTLKVPVPGDVVYTYVVSNTGSADLENVVLTDDNATPDTSDDITVSCPGTIAAGTSVTCNVTLPVSFGLTFNIAVVTANPVLDAETTVSATDDAAVAVPEPALTPTPRVTPPPTSTLDGEATGPAGSGLLLVLAAIAGLMLAAGYLKPARVTARRRNRKS